MTQSRQQTKVDTSSPEAAVLDALVDLAPIPLAMGVISYGRTLWCGNTLRLAREENRITGLWDLDYQYHRRLYG